MEQLTNMKTISIIRTGSFAMAAAFLLSAAPTVQGDSVQVTGNLTGPVTWHHTNEYLLNGFVYALSNSVLTIEPRPRGANTSPVPITV